jgi:hypothetical protein
VDVGDLPNYVKYCVSVLKPPLSKYQYTTGPRMGSRNPQQYDADEAAKWGIFGWLTGDHSSPLVDVFTQASGDMVDFHISTVFQALNSEENYLRIQVLLYHSLVVI